MARTNSLPTTCPATVSRGHRRTGGVDTGPTRVDEVSGGKTPNRSDAVSPTTPQYGATERDRPLFGARGIARWAVRLGGRRLMSSRVLAVATTTPNDALMSCQGSVSATVLANQ